MTEAKSSFLSADLLRETRKLLSGEEVASGFTDRAAKFLGAYTTKQAAPPNPAQQERLYLRYGGAVLQALEAAGEPLSDRQIFERVHDSVSGASFDELRQVLQEMLARGMLAPAGPDPVFGDPRFAGAPAA